MIPPPPFPCFCQEVTVSQWPQTQTGYLKLESRVKVMLWLRVCLCGKPQLTPKIRFLLLSDGCGFLDVGAPFMMIGKVCNLQLLLVLTSSVIIVSKSCRTHNHILLSRIQGFSYLEGKVPVCISPRGEGAWFYPQTLGSLHRFLGLAGLWWRYSNLPPQRHGQSQWCFMTGTHCFDFV
jgi:hypothetical protein